MYSHIIPYCSPTSSLRQLNHLDRYPWRMMISPISQPRIRGVSNGFAIDNGAWTYHKKKIKFCSDPFMKLVSEIGTMADFIVIPDKVEDAIETHRMAETWIKRLEKYRLVFVAQDGMIARDLEQYVRAGIGIFIGGSTEWKLKSIKPISALCIQHDVICHVGRVNTNKRVNLCINGGAHSFDGSGMARFEETARLITDQMIRLESDLFPRSFDTIKKRYIHHEN